jgi:hypothetical protein
VLLWIADRKIAALSLTESAQARPNSGNASKNCYLQTGRPEVSLKDSR